MPKQVKNPLVRRYVIRLTLYEDDEDHAPIIDMLDSSSNKGRAVIAAMVDGASAESELCDSEDEFDDFDDLFE